MTKTFLPLKKGNKFSKTRSGTKKVKIVCGQERGAKISQNVTQTFINSTRRLSSSKAGESFVRELGESQLSVKIMKETDSFEATPGQSSEMTS